MNVVQMCLLSRVEHEVRHPVQQRCAGIVPLAIMSLVLLSGCQNLPVNKAALDSDGDGVRDSRDRCAHTVPEPAVLETLSKDGCSVLDGPLNGLDFAPDQHTLDVRARQVLDTLVQALHKRPELTIDVGGHTDNRGKAAGNLELSKRRVMEVCAYLVQQGIEAWRLLPYGYGESRPIVSNATTLGRRQNRRIEISVAQAEL